MPDLSHSQSVKRGLGWCFELIEILVTLYPHFDEDNFARFSSMCVCVCVFFFVFSRTKLYI